MRAGAAQISVVIATHNRRDVLRRCLEALSRQTADPTLVEVVVVDDGSSDGTAEMAEAFEAPFAVRALRLPKGGKSAALNAGIEAAAGDVCLFLDDDIVASPGLVEEHLAAHREDPTTLGIGVLRQEPPSEGDHDALAFAEIWNERYRERLDREADWADCYGANFSAPRAALAEVGGFAVDLPAVEDLELAFRLCEAGCIARLLPDATAVHDDQKPGRRILADEERFGAWCADFVQDNPRARHRLLGWFNTLTIQEITLRRLLLTLRVPASTLAWLGRLVPSGSRRQAWFGFVSRHAFWLGVRRSMDRSHWLQTTRGVPVLMYHAFSETDEIDRFVMPKRSFARQMRMLSLLRYRVIRFEDLAAALAEGRNLPRRAVAITIDDGYLDNFEIAALLRKRGFPATVFLVSDRLGANNDWDSDGVVAGRALLSQSEIDRMRSGGSIRFGAHTRTHAELPTIAHDLIESEVKGSRERLERTLETDVLTFAYPYGQFDDRTVGAVAEAGFHGACTAYARRARVGDDPLLIPRIEIRGEDSLPRFLRKLWFGGA